MRSMKRGAHSERSPKQTHAESHLGRRARERRREHKEFIPTHAVGRPLSARQGDKGGCGGGRRGETDHRGEQTLDRSGEASWRRQSDFGVAAQPLTALFETRRSSAGTPGRAVTSAPVAHPRDGAAPGSPWPARGPRGLQGVPVVCRGSLHPGATPPTLEQVSIGWSGAELVSRLETCHVHHGLVMRVSFAWRKHGESPVGAATNLQIHVYHLQRASAHKLHHEDMKECRHLAVHL
ncbi:unnamed protein product [Lampetra fluviatilis]